MNRERESGRMRCVCVSVCGDAQSSAFGGASIRQRVGKRKRKGQDGVSSKSEGREEGEGDFGLSLPVSVCVRESDAQTQEMHANQHNSRTHHTWKKKGAGERWAGVECLVRATCRTGVEFFPPPNWHKHTHKHPVSGATPQRVESSGDEGGGVSSRPAADAYRRGAGEERKEAMQRRARRAWVRRSGGEAATPSPLFSLARRVLAECGA